MSKKVVQSKSLDKKAVWWVGFFLFAVTIYFNSKAQDPFNAPKFWVLLVGAAWILGYLISYLKNSRDDFSPLIKKIFLLTLAFLAFSTISLFASENNQIALFGDNMRKNGFLTYLALVIFFLSTIAFVTKNNLIQLYKFMLLTAYAVGGYGLLQITGNDFIPWSASGMAIFSTLGNSNFAGSAMAILAIVTLGGAYIYRKVTWILISSVAAFTILLITIFPTNARQGLLLLFFGIGALAIVLIYNYNRILGRIAIVISAFGFVASILGMLQIGPLERLLYKDSVSVRGYYWRAGISMLQDNLWFGVGLDNYGTFFKQYREVGYPLKYGYSLTSTNAHNVFIQHFATGGLFVGISYLLLTVFIFWRGLKSMRVFNGDERFIRSVFFVAWLAFQGQSLISIDNIGISIWGWVLGGVVVALSREPDDGKLSATENQKVVRRDKQEFNLLQPVVSVLFGSLALVLVLFLQRGESAIFQQRAAYNPAVPAQKEIFFQLATKTINTPLIDLQNKVMTATYLHGMGYKSEAVALLEDLHAEDPNSLDTLTFLASYYEMTGEINKALVMREKIAVLDPWNANNYLQMAFNYKFISDEANKKLYLDKAYSFAPNDENVIKAKLELEQ
jgi:O-antigen ligase